MQKQKPLPILTTRDVKFAVLEVLSKTNHQHKMNMLGRPGDKGNLEYVLDRIFENEERAMADRVIEELKRDQLIIPTYSDIADPGNWLKITDKGRRALELRSLDSLDEALIRIDPGLVELRFAVASSSLMPSDRESIRNAAHSARELLRQVLDKIAPEEEMRLKPGFIPSKESKTGITRKMRVRHALKKLNKASDSDTDLIDALSSQIDILYNKFSAEAHRNVNEDQRDIKDLIGMLESALNRLLL